MKKFVLWIVLAASLILALMLSACGTGSNLAALYGTWTFQESAGGNGPTAGTTMQFNADGSLAIDLQDGNGPINYNFASYDADELIICSTTPCDLDNFANWIGFMHYSIKGTTMNAIISDMPLVLDKTP